MRTIWISGDFNWINLAEHNRAVQWGVKYPCRYQLSSKGHLAEHKMAVHGVGKYPCELSGYQANLKGHLAEHNSGVHEGVKHPCR